MADEVVLNKAAIIERCLERIREEYVGHEDELGRDYTRQDAIVLNLLRACEAAIDLAMHVVRIRRLGLPQDSREAFSMLEDGGLIDARLSSEMRAMVGFRNVAVHEYQKMNLEILRAILEGHLSDLRGFARAMVEGAGESRRYD